MKNKEIATALGLSFALAVSGCGAKNEPVETVQVEESAPVEIEADTTAPEISVKNDIKSVDLGTTIKPEDYAEAKDENDVTLFFVTESGDESELEIPADLDISVTEINFTVVAVDSKGNRSEEVTVTIPVVHADTQSSETKGEYLADGIFDGSDEETTAFYNAEAEEAYLEAAESGKAVSADKAKTQEVQDELSARTEALDKTMYAVSAVNVRSGDSTNYEKVGALVWAQQVHVTGRSTESKWFRIEMEDGTVAYVSNNYLSDTKPQEQPKATQQGSQTSSVTATGNPNLSEEEKRRIIDEKFGLDKNGNSRYTHMEVSPPMITDFCCGELAGILH